MTLHLELRKTSVKNKRKRNGMNFGLWNEQTKTVGMGLSYNPLDSSALSGDKTPSGTIKLFA